MRIGGHNPIENFNSNTSLVVHSEPENNSEPHEQTLTREAKQNMLLEMLKCSLISVKVNEAVKAEEIYQLFDSVQMHILKENIEKKLTHTLEARKTQ